MKMTFKHAILLFLCALAATGCSSQIGQPEEIAAETAEEKAAASEVDFSDTLTATELIKNINVGYNIGNSLDSCPSNGRNDGSYTPNYYETLWGNPVITTAYIDTIKAAGFNIIKVPETWYYNTYPTSDNSLTIRREWLQRAAEIVDYAISQDLYVILDSHHDENILWADMEDIDEVSANLKTLWSQIAEYFQDYDEHLIFEGFNEINTPGNSWTYSESTLEAVNILNQCFVDTVRDSGGFNADRLLICDTYLSSGSEAILDGYQLPQDTVADRLLIGIHCYSEIYSQDMNDTFRLLDAFSSAQNAPVLITEFGTTSDYIPKEYRSLHAGNYIAYASDYNIKCLWWDDGGSYSLIDRSANAISEEAIVAALMNPSKFYIEKLTVKSYNTIKLYTYGDIDSTLGVLTDSADGILTLNADGKGASVSPGLGYHINLSISKDADGLRIHSIAFYDKDESLIEYTSVTSQTYDITAPETACYMRVSIYNPWGHRSLEQYQSYLDKEEMQLEITEYRK